MDWMLETGWVPFGSRREPGWGPQEHELVFMGAQELLTQTENEALCGKSRTQSSGVSREPKQCGGWCLVRSRGTTALGVGLEELQWGGGGLRKAWEVHRGKPEMKPRWGVWWGEVYDSWRRHRLAVGFP